MIHKSHSLLISRLQKRTFQIILKVYLLNQLSIASTFIGTPNYMAPEVVLGRTRHGRKADIWSVGCTLIEMLTTKPPWDDLEPMAIIFNIAQHNPSYELPLEADPDLAYLISIIFERDVDKRPSASQLLNNFAFHKFPNIS